MQDSNFSDTKEKKRAAIVRGATQEQKILNGCLITIAILIVSSVIMVLGGKIVGLLIAFFVGLPFFFRTISIISRNETPDELEASIVKLTDKISDDKIVGDKLAKLRYHRGLDYTFLYTTKWETSNLPSELDFSPLFSARDDFQWIIDNSKNEKLKKKAQKKILYIIKNLANNLEETEHLESRQACALTMVKLGKETIPKLKEVMQKKFSVSVWAHYALNMLGDKSDDHLGPIIAAINGSESKDDRKAAILAIEKIGSEAKAAITEIKKAINDEDQDIRIMAEQVLKKM